MHYVALTVCVAIGLARGAISFLFELDILLAVGNRSFVVLTIIIVGC